MRIISTFSLMLCLATPLLAQNELIIEPGTSENPVFINDIIHADTTAEGERVNPDRIYVLRRNGLYFVSQELNIGDNKLHIKAEEGEGFRPFIAPWPNEESRYPRMFRVSGDLLLESLHWNNINGEAYKWGGNASTGSNSRIEIKDCFIERDGGAAWMSYGLNSTFIFENCVIGNMGAPKKVGGNGRFFDTRGNATDSVIIRHCTIYLLSDRIVRNLGGELDYLEFDHNTAINVQGRHGSFTLGKTKNIKITNNLLINPLYMGNHPGTEEQTHPDNENFYVIAMDTTYEDMTLEIHHNNITFLQEVKDYYATNDSVSEPAVLEPLVESALGDAAEDAFFTEEITFTAVPPFPMDYLISIFANPNADFHPDNFDVTLGMPNIDASYSTSSQSYTADEDGNPVGSHQWWSELPNSTQKRFSEESMFTIFPNPAYDFVNITYDLHNNAPVSIVVYDLQGRVVLTHNEGFRNSGKNHARLSVMSLNSGIYMLSVKSDSNSSSMQRLVVY